MPTKSCLTISVIYDQGLWVIAARPSPDAQQPVTLCEKTPSVAFEHPRLSPPPLPRRQPSVVGDPRVSLTSEPVPETTAWTPSSAVHTSPWQIDGVLDGPFRVTSLGGDSHVTDPVDRIEESSNSRRRVVSLYDGTTDGETTEPWDRPSPRLP